MPSRQDLTRQLVALEQKLATAERRLGLNPSDKERERLLAARDRLAAETTGIAEQLRRRNNALPVREKAPVAGFNLARYAETFDIDTNELPRLYAVLKAAWTWGQKA